LRAGAGVQNRGVDFVQVVEVVDQGAHVRVAVVRVALQAARHDRRQLRRNARFVTVEPGNRALEMLRT